MGVGRSSGGKIHYFIGQLNDDYGVKFELVDHDSHDVTAYQPAVSLSNKNGVLVMFSNENDDKRIYSRLGTLAE